MVAPLYCNRERESSRTAFNIHPKRGGRDGDLKNKKCDIRVSYRLQSEPKQSPENRVNQKYEDPKDDRGKSIKFKAGLRIYQLKKEI